MRVLLPVIAALSVTTGFLACGSESPVQAGLFDSSEKETETPTTPPQIHKWTNKDGCVVEASRVGSSWVLNASQFKDDTTKQVQVSLADEINESKITTYCKDSRSPHFTSTANGTTVKVNCGAEAAVVSTNFSTDTENTPSLASFELEAHHTFFLFRRDDSFTCLNLIKSN